MNKFGKSRIKAMAPKWNKIHTCKM